MNTKRVLALNCYRSLACQRAYTTSSPPPTTTGPITGRDICPLRPLTSPLVQGFAGAIGNTPLIRLDSFSRKTGCNIYAKAEFMNPGGSVKDRAALWVIRDAELKGLIGPGGTIVEGTAGNTGIGLAHICRARGYKCIIFMPDNQSEEKVDALRNLGAQVNKVPVVPYTDPQNYNHLASHFAHSQFNCVWTDQFDNVANAQAHYESTGPELAAQLNGIDLHAFTCATGTGGTLAGIALYFQHHVLSRTKFVLADPPGSVLFSYFNKPKGADLERTGSASITEGIGQGRITENLALALDPNNPAIHSAVHVPDETTVTTLFRLLHDEGIPVGASSAMNLAAALLVAKQLGPGHNIATILCDGATRYANRLYSKAWLESKNLLQSVPRDCLYYLK